MVIRKIVRKESRLEDVFVRYSEEFAVGNNQEYDDRRRAV